MRATIPASLFSSTSASQTAAQLINQDLALAATFLEKHMLKRKPVNKPYNSLILLHKKETSNK